MYAKGGPAWAGDKYSLFIPVFPEQETASETRTGASLENGLLHVDLVREIPEAMKPRAIPIASSSKRLEVKPTKVAA